jgi:glycine hydroxymethyltransferase
MRPVSGGTDTHLIVVDLRQLGRGPAGITGAEAERRCGLARISVNKNAIPYDPQPPMVASGIRVGSPSVTTQGMREAQVRRVADLVAAAVRADPATTTGRSTLADVADEVVGLVSRFPAYPARIAEPGRAMVTA